MSMMDVIQNNSIEFINFNNRLLAKLLMNICTLLSGSFAIIISLLIIVYVFVIYTSGNHSRNSFNVSLILTCNTCLAIICSSIIVILIQLSNIIGDHAIIYLKWIIFSGCHTRGYLLFVFINSIYLSYVLQAGYRLFRIVFHEYKCLRTSTTFFYYILGQWLLSFVVLIPILFAGENHTPSIIYLPEDFYCQVPVTNVYAITYAVQIVFILPFCCICTIYFWIIIYIRRNTRYRQSVSTLKLRIQNKRDSIIIKRICIVVVLLLILGAPTVILVIVFIINSHFYWAYYRLSCMTISISYSFICLSSIYVTPEIYRPIRIIFGYSNHYRGNLEDLTPITNTTRTQTKMDHSVLRARSSVNTV